MIDMVRIPVTEDEEYMKEAMKQARKAYKLGEVPIGCVIVHEGRIIGRGYNRRNTDKNTLAHAEITAINCGCEISRRSLRKCSRRMQPVYQLKIVIDKRTVKVYS